MWIETREADGGDQIAFEIVERFPKHSTKYVGGNVMKSEIAVTYLAIRFHKENPSARDKYKNQGCPFVDHEKPAHPTHIGGKQPNFLYTANQHFLFYYFHKCFGIQ